MKLKINHSFFIEFEYQSITENKKGGDRVNKLKQLLRMLVKEIYAELIK